MHSSVTSAVAAPAPKAGAAPRAPRPQRPAAKPRCDCVAPRAHPALPKAPPPRHTVNGTPEVLAAAMGLGGVALGADVTAALALRSAAYVSRLATSIARCVSNPYTTGEHIAEGIVGGAAWAGAAAGVTALADAARTHAPPSHVAPR
jgi:hypothetical protein